MLYTICSEISINIWSTQKCCLPQSVSDTFLKVKYHRVQICAELWLIWIKKAGRVCLHSSSQTRYRFTPPPLTPASPVIIPLFLVFGLSGWVGCDCGELDLYASLVVCRHILWQTQLLNTSIWLD